MSHVPAKIVLKSTTTKSLNDRFTEMAKMQIRSAPQVTVTGVRSNQFQVAQASMKNRRLAAQMANRPGVQAALGGNTSDLKSRLGSPSRGRGRGANRGLLKNRLGSPAVGGRNRGGAQGGVGGGLRRGSNVRGVSRGKRGGGLVGRGGRGVMKAVTRGGRGGRGSRGGRGAQNVTRGRGRGRGRGDKPVSKDKLDEELDHYMSNTKSHLDAELDAYMQNAVGDEE